MLAKTYAGVRRSIVAFASKVAVSTKAPAFPTIIGTGFVVDSRGLVITNSHVVRALEQLPNHPQTGASAAFALAFSEVVPENRDKTLQTAIDRCCGLLRGSPSGPSPPEGGRSASLPAPI